MVQPPEFTMCSMWVSSERTGPDAYVYRDTKYMYQHATSICRIKIQMQNEKKLTVALTCSFEFRVALLACGFILSHTEIRRMII